MRLKAVNVAKYVGCRGSAPDLTALPIDTKLDLGRGDRGEKGGKREEREEERREGKVGLPRKNLG